MFEDKLLTCKDCGKDFVFTVREQEFFAEKGFEHAPSRCQDCREARKARMSEAGYKRMDGRTGEMRQTFEAVCAECGVTTDVPFKPKEDRPVYCQRCYRQKRQRY
jgi:CxxC-x17-CxxC domain-containing protein